MNMKPDINPRPDSAGIDCGRFRALSDEEEFCFRCVPERCDLRCCTTGHPLVLNPYEIHLISSKTGISFDTLEDELFAESFDPETGFPLVTIARERTCGFLRDRGCSIYEVRPLVCRLFPLGKYLHPGEPAFRTVLLSDNACAGFSQEVRQSTGHYRREQDCARLDGIWEAWVDFVSATETLGPLPDSSLFRSVFAMFVYNNDLPPAPEVSLEEYAAMSIEEAFHLRLKSALHALPKLLAIFEKQRSRVRPDSSE